MPPEIKFHFPLKERYSGDSILLVSRSCCNFSGRNWDTAPLSRSINTNSTYYIDNSKPKSFLGSQDPPHSSCL